MAPNRSKSQKPSHGAAGSLAFDQAALSQLTAKIDRTLESQNALKLNDGKPNGGKPNGGKRKRGVDTAGDDVDDGGDEGKAGNAAKAQKKKKKKPVAAAAAAEAEATPSPAKTNGHRDDAKAKPSPAKTNGHRDDAKTKGGAPENKADKKAVMLDEIKALGGDEADWELVAGLDSDAEEGGGGGSGGTKSGAAESLGLDTRFQSELAKFAAGLGFDQVREDDAEEGAEEGRAEEQADEDEAEEDEGEEEEEEEAPRKEAPRKETPKAEAKPVPTSDPFLPRNPRFAKLILEPRTEWHTTELGALPAPVSDDVGAFSATMARLKTYAESLLEADAVAYQGLVASSSSHRFMSTIKTSGTVSDKVSALTLEVQEAPVHTSKTMETLLGFAAKRSRGQAMAALGALVDLLGNGGLLPSDRRLRTFFAQPGLVGALQAARPAAAARAWQPHQPLPGGLTKAHLVLWQYEDWLKDAFFRLLQQLEVWSGDEIEYSRSRSLDFVFGLLRSKPEQEANLLRLLVNKLGDRERKIASRASYLLLQLLNTHPGMKPIVVQTVEQEVLLRPGQSLRAQYYAINTLNQTILSSKEPAVADALVRIYFELFLVLLKSGALGAIDLGGKAGGGADAAIADGGDKAKNKRRRGHDKPERPEKPDKDKSKSSKNEGNERDVAEKLVSALLTGVNRAIPFATTDSSTLETHLDTLFRITHSSNFNTSIQALMLVQQVAVSKQVAVDRFYRTLYESLLDPRLATSSKQAMYLNLLYRALKNDVDARRVKAFAKRMLQVATLHQPPFVCGLLFMIVELETTFPDLKALLTEPEAGEDDEEERYYDVPEEDEGEDDRATAAAAAAAATAAADAAKARRTAYDGRKRDPSYSHAEQSCLWELVPYLRHFHPSVTAFASNLLVRKTSLPKPDMANHTLMHFLDKFVYRSPKKAAAGAGAGVADVVGGGKARGTSIMQPLAAPSTGAAQIVVPGKGHGTAAASNINSAEFWSQDVRDVAAEDVFFHAYFAQVGKQAQTSRAAKRASKQDQRSGGGGGADAAEAEAADSEAEEEEIWQALKGSRPDIEGEDDEEDLDMDDDDDLSGLESLLGMSDSDDDDGDEEEEGDGAAEEMDVDGGSDGGVEFADFGEDDGEDDDDDNGDEGGAATADGKAKGGLVSLADGRKAGRLRRKELKALPTFASVEDYAAMLGDEEDEDY